MNIKLKDLFHIYDNDKTPEYSYHGKNKKNRVGESPGIGSRFLTPRELIRDYLIPDFWEKYKKFKENPDE